MRSGVLYYGRRTFGIFLALFYATFVLGLLSAGADTITIYPADNGLDSNNAATVDSTAASYAIGKSSTNIYRYVAQFDIASVIPPDSTINSAYFEIYETGGGSSGKTFECYQLTEVWNTAYACWSNRDNGIAWTTVGGTYNPTLLSSYTSVKTANVPACLTVTAAVRSWLAAPASNCGLILKNAAENGASTNNTVFYASEGSISPRLYVDYTPATWVRVGDSINNNAADASAPSLSLCNGTPYVAYLESDGTRNALYVKFYNGSDWEQIDAALNLSTTRNAYSPCLTFNGTTPWVAWSEPDEILDVNQIYVKYYNGSAWQPLSSSPSTLGLKATTPRLAFKDGTLYLAYLQSNGISSLLLRTEYWNGASWIAVGNAITTMSTSSPNLAFIGNTPYVAYRESSYYVRAKHYNGSWVQDGGDLNNASMYGRAGPQMAVNNSIPYVAWTENSGAYYNTGVKYFNGADWTPLGEAVNVNTAQVAEDPSLVFVGTTPYIAWDESDGTVNQLYVKYFNGTSWVADGGSLNIYYTHNVQTACCLAVDNDTPYIAWSETNGANYQVYVKRKLMTEVTASPTCAHRQSLRRARRLSPGHRPAPLLTRRPSRRPQRQPAPQRPHLRKQPPPLSL